ncbi:MAG: hypothetical protein DRN57_04435 [Thermoplasmata archaeon]|nr:MAG: hypothetical protein DRN57_04435 [Thermoplasmata archaeon]
MIMVPHLQRLVRSSKKVKKSDTNDNTFVSELLTPTPEVWWAKGIEEYLKSQTTRCFEIPV